MLKKMALGIFLILLISTGFYVYNKLHYVPQVFPLDNTQASYKITKGCPAQSGGKEFGAKGMVQKQGYCLEYRGDSIFEPLDSKQNFYRITVGFSSQDLKEFQNKEIVIRSGEFVQGDKQCIHDKCLALGGSSILLNLNSITLK